MTNSLKTALFTLVLLSPFIFLSCQKEIEVDIPDYERKIVIEGSIENGSPAMVLVSKSVRYFSTLDLETLMNDVFIRDAIVTVESSDGETEQLNWEYCEDSPVYFAYVGQMKGKAGRTYKLRVEWNGQVYTSETSIREPFHLDSAWLAVLDENDTLPTSRIQLSDNPSTKDYYQFRIKVHGKKLHDRLWVTSMPVAFDDATFNGQTVNYEILRANPSALFAATMSEEEQREYYRLTYRRGDTIYLKTSMLDAPGFDYWSAMTYELAIGQNPFMSPAPVPCNIQGENVIGVWCGYGSTVDTLYYLEDGTMIPSSHNTRH
ncbi:MAG: DUF4249 domain-containing protein [Bacteroidales bacterium]|nr:DUF4249 domain-containing protein [Bacteroidales bacterium]